MKDRLLLLIAAAALAIAAWGFWHFLDDDAFAVITLIALVGVVADNHRLRRKLRERTHQ